MSITVEGNIGIVLEGGKVWGRSGDGRNVRKFSVFTVRLTTNQRNASLTKADNLLTVFVYVAFRNNRPKEETVKDVLKDLKGNNIDVNQLVEWSADHCHQRESSTTKDCSA